MVANQLRMLITNVKDYDYQCKELQTQIQTGQHKYDDVMNDIGGQKQLEKIKKQLKHIKNELKKLTTHEALIYNSLYGFRVKLSGEQHYLYDLDKAVGKAKEFTEDDLKYEEQDEKDFEFKVQSKPRKVSMYEQQNVDPNNPYLNQNIDADLGRVIGGPKKGKRKQINTAAFMLGDA